MKSETLKTPLVILAMDTGDYDAIQKWTKAGYLPTLKAIMDRGSYGKITGPEMICEYGVGMSLFSGISRAQHGYYYFRQLDPGSYNLKTVSPHDYNLAPFWCQLLGQDKKVLIMDVPDTYPVKNLPGIQLANWATHHGAGEHPMAEPTAILEEVKSVFGPQIIVRGGAESKSFEEDLKKYQKLLKRIEQKGKLCQHFLAKEDYDLITIFFSETDPAANKFWKYQSEEKQHELSHSIRDIYQAIDRELGKIIAQLSSDANIFITSLYGSQDEYPTSTLSEAFCRQLGYHVAPSTQQKKQTSFNPLQIARKIIPEPIRLTISRLLPQSTQEKLLAATLNNNTDWSKTTAFAIPSLFTSFIRVNLKGREPQGIVEPGKDYQQLLDKIEKDLFQLTDPDTGKRVIKRVGRTTELFNCAPHDSLPDLFVEWEPVPKFLAKVVHPKASLIQKRPQYCPDNQEKLTGFIAACGPIIEQKGALGEIEGLDLAPTFLILLGQPIPEDMKGKLLHPLIRKKEVV